MIWNVIHRHCHVTLEVHSAVGDRGAQAMVLQPLATVHDREGERGAPQLQNTGTAWTEEAA